MTDYLTFLLGGKGFAILPVLLLAGASWSIGGTLLRFLAPGLESDQLFGKSQTADAAHIDIQ